MTLARRTTASLAAVLAVAAACGTGRHRLPPPVNTSAPPSPRATASSTKAPLIRPSVKATVAAAPTPTIAPIAPAPTIPNIVPGGALAVGDSILEDVRLYARMTLLGHGIAINAAVSRHWGSGVQMLGLLRAHHQLPPTVVFALAANDTLTDVDFEQMINAVDPTTRVIVVTIRLPRPWQDGNNHVLCIGAARHRQVGVVEWHRISDGHPEWFAPDAVHLGPLGAQVFGNAIAWRALLGVNQPCAPA